MRNFLFVMITCLFISACGQTNSDSTAATEKSDRVVLKKDSITVIKNTIHTDSIETANNASIQESGNNVTKAYVSKRDSSISLTAEMRVDHRIFGYANPDTKSERLLLLSIFTSDVENNPFGCKLGSYYGTDGMQKIKLKYLETVGNFIKVAAIDSSNVMTSLYFEKKWIVFE